MRKLFFNLLIVLLLSTVNFSQTATKIDNFTYIYCGDFLLHMQILYQDQIYNKPQNRIVIIYYEGKREFTKYNDKSKKYEKVIENPKLGNALNRAKEIPLYLKMTRKIPNNKFILIDGGYREFFEIEIWTIPEGAELPKATPTLERKDIKFMKGKVQPPRRMACCYDDC